MQHPIQDLPEDSLVYLLGSRYCETDRLTPLAWSLFSNTPEGWPRVQAICDYVHNRIEFGYHHADPDSHRLAGHHEGRGVCRDFAHLAIALCRCMNIPARYCTGYLGDIGIPPVDAPMDFSAWFEVYLGGHWHTFDARHNTPRIGRILMARGRDATDVALSTIFGPSSLVGFNVVTDEVGLGDGWTTIETHGGGSRFSSSPRKPESHATRICVARGMASPTLRVRMTELTHRFDKRGCRRNTNGMRRLPSP